MMNYPKFRNVTQRRQTMRQATHKVSGRPLPRIPSLRNMKPPTFKFPTGFPFQSGFPFGNRLRIRP